MRLRRAFPASSSWKLFLSICAVRRIPTKESRTLSQRTPVLLLCCAVARLIINRVSARQGKGCGVSEGEAFAVGL
eukprot:11215748-Lingulodinium_polyedra.AAC.1